MSTKSSFLHREENNDNHELNVHVYHEGHEEGKNVTVELSCSTCYCHYVFTMTEHLGIQLAEALKKGIKDAWLYGDKE